jgi:dihydroneopterin aldolase
MTSAGVIEIRGLRATGRHGVAEQERSVPQPFEIDLDLALDMTRAALTDQVSETVDYGIVVQTVAAVVANSSYHLLEALADAIASAVLSEPRCEQVTVTVRKLRPPVPLDLRTAGVRLTRAR